MVIDCFVPGFDLFNRRGGAEEEEAKQVEMSTQMKTLFFLFLLKTAATGLGLFSESSRDAAAKVGAICKDETDQSWRNKDLVRAASAVLSCLPNDLVTTA
jgi:hypothetical protein